MIVAISPECMIAKKGFDEQSVVASVGQPRVLQKVSVCNRSKDIIWLKRKAKED